MAAKPASRLPPQNTSWKNCDVQDQTSIAQKARATLLRISTTTDAASLGPMDPLQRLAKQAQETNKRLKNIKAGLSSKSYVQAPPLHKPSPPIVDRTSPRPTGPSKRSERPISRSNFVSLDETARSVNFNDRPASANSRPTNSKLNQGISSSPVPIATQKAVRKVENSIIVSSPLRPDPKTAITKEGASRTKDTSTTTSASQSNEQTEKVPRGSRSSLASLLLFLETSSSPSVANLPVSVMSLASPKKAVSVDDSIVVLQPEFIVDSQYRNSSGKAISRSKSVGPSHSVPSSSLPTSSSQTEWNSARKVASGVKPRYAASPMGNLRLTWSDRPQPQHSQQPAQDIAAPLPDRPARLPSLDVVSSAKAHIQSTTNPAVSFTLQDSGNVQRSLK